VLVRSLDRAHSTVEPTKRQRSHLHTVGRSIALGRTNPGPRCWTGVCCYLYNCAPPNLS
jgi:hypothetical protein